LHQPSICRWCDYLTPPPLLPLLLLLLLLLLQISPSTHSRVINCAKSTSFPGCPSSG
jgi:hypothetical protein